MRKLVGKIAKCMDHSDHSMKHRFGLVRKFQIDNFADHFSRIYARNSVQSPKLCLVGNAQSWERVEGSYSVIPDHKIGGYGAIWLILCFSQLWSFCIGPNCRQVIIWMMISEIMFGWKCSKVRRVYGKLLSDSAPQNRWLWRYLISSAPLWLF